MSLVDLIKRTRVDEFSLVKLIEEHFLDNRVKDPINTDDWLRVSSLGMLCEREEVICSLENVVRAEKIDPHAGVNFEHGHYVHWLFQNKVLPTLGVIIGSWRCVYCGTVYGSRDTVMIPRPDRCIRCGAIAGDRPRSNGRPDNDIDDNAFLFVEEWLGNEEHRIGGSPDGQMISSYTPEYKIEDLTLIEFKSCNAKNFLEYKKAPDFVHAIQAQLYLWLAGYRKAKILYFNKNGGKDSIAEHDLEYDVECVDRVLAGVKRVRDGIANNKVPPRVVCQDYGCPRAERCQVRDLCFK